MSKSKARVSTCVTLLERGRSAQTIRNILRVQQNVLDKLITNGAVYVAHKSFGRTFYAIKDIEAVTAEMVDGPYKERIKKLLNAAYTEIVLRSGDPFTGYVF